MNGRQVTVMIPFTDDPTQTWPLYTVDYMLRKITDQTQKPETDTKPLG